MGKLSTHVLDTMNGRPARQVQIDLYRVNRDSRILVTTRQTNDDGRCDDPLLETPDFTPGIYELVFHAGDYFAKLGIDMPEPRFVDQVIVRFGIARSDENYHVPLLVTPWAWSTYRGS